MPVNPKKIIVAFSTIQVPGLPEPEFTAPGNYKDQAKIDAYIAEKKEAYKTESANQPYTGTFAEVQISDPASSDTGRWVCADRHPFGDKQAISLSVRAWLLKRWKDAWPNTTNSMRHEPEVIFVGFNPRLFLKILGIECSLPENQPKNADGSIDHSRMNILPLSMWYGNSDHRDIAEAVMPKDVCKDVGWKTVLHRRGLLEKFSTWNGPGVNVEQDLDLATDLVDQLGMLVEGDELVQI